VDLILVCISPLFLVRWDPCQYGMGHPQVVDRGDGSTDMDGSCR